MRATKQTGGEFSRGRSSKATSETIPPEKSLLSLTLTLGLGFGLAMTTFQTP